MGFVFLLLGFLAFVFIFEFVRKEVAHRDERMDEFKRGLRADAELFRRQRETGHDLYNNDVAVKYSGNVTHPEELPSRPRLSQVLALTLLKDPDGEYVNVGYADLTCDAALAIWRDSERPPSEEMMARMKFFWPQLDREARSHEFTAEPLEPHLYLNLKFDGVLCMLECDEGWSRERLVAWVAEQDDYWNARAARPLNISGE